MIEKFTRAVDKGLKYVLEHDSEEIAKVLIDFFPDTSLSDMKIIVERYKTGDAWKKNITISEEEWRHIQEIIKAALELDNEVSYDKLIYSKYFKDYE